MAKYVSPRTVGRDAKLRAQALTAARIQFSGSSPTALLRAAEEIYQWMKCGAPAVPEKPVPIEAECGQERFNREIQALLAAGVEPFKALNACRAN